MFDIVSVVSRKRGENVVNGLSLIFLTGLANNYTRGG